MRYIDTGGREPSNALGSWFEDQVFKAATEIGAIRWQSGFANAGFLGWFEPAFRILEAADGVTRLLVGSNDGATTSATVATLLAVAGAPRSSLEIGVVRFDNAYFHPKTVHLTRLDGSQAAYVGSANLTGPGVSSLHVEAGVLLDSRSGDDLGVLTDVAKAIDDWFSTGRAGLHLVRETLDIAQLVADRVLDVPKPPKPTASKVSVASAPKPATLGPLIGSPPLPIAGVAISVVGAPPSAPHGGAGSPTPPVVPAEAWSKPLTRSDAQRKAMGNQRGSITLVEAPSPFATATYFKDRLLVPATWTTSATRTGRPLETAAITFDVSLLGRAFGSVDLLVTFDPDRASGQNNYTTLLHLGPLTAEFAATDMTGKRLAIVRRSDDTYGLAID